MSQSKENPQPCSIFELAADLLNKPEFMAAVPKDSVPVIQRLEKILKGLGTGKIEQIEETLDGLTNPKESKLLQEIGQMTRSLHNSLEEFKASLDRNNLDMHSTNLPDATNKLESVIQMTFEAANKTMSNMDRQAEVIESIKANLKAYKLRLPIDKQSDSFLGKLEYSLGELSKIGSETIVSQSFQDLSGQQIRKVIKLVTHLETHLVSLIKVFGVHSKNASCEPNLQTKDQSKQAVAQEDVEALLESFGF